MSETVYGGLGPSMEPTSSRSKRAEQKAAREKRKAEQEARRGEPLEDGYNCSSCSCGAGHVVEWEYLWWEGRLCVPYRLQTSGFACDACDEWAHNDCGDRQTRTCHGCIRYRAVRQ